MFVFKYILFCSLLSSIFPSWKYFLWKLYFVSEKVLYLFTFRELLFFVISLFGEYIPFPFMRESSVSIILCSFFSVFKYIGFNNIPLSLLLFSFEDFNPKAFSTLLILLFLLLGGSDIYFSRF